MVKFFSERAGLRAPPQIAQLRSVSVELRNELWNVFVEDVTPHSSFSYQDFVRVMWRYLLKRPVDTVPEPRHTYGGSDNSPIHAEIRGWFFDAKWNEVFDFVEFVVLIYSKHLDALPDLINRALERENSGYRLVNNLIAPIVSDVEVEEVQEAARAGDAAASHIDSAVRLLADRKSPDYRNAMKEAISAVEAIAKAASGLPKATLDSALGELEKRGALHAALKSAFSKLYGYTSNADGIRHALVDEPNLTQADARYFIVVCSAFVNLMRAAVIDVRSPGSA